ncbi:YiiD C-terminal domain-containing protein [Endozoicomonas lisbonensis]|uniref:Thioesterase domain-containing protein n=1 Tax=Endozoicomonas lisbonensis TaxID=3120522 RepID=A0ABV2SNW8_9GAMM
MQTPQLTQDFKDWVMAEIPLLTAMELSLDEFRDGQLSLSCPLAPNINDKGTAFGGSIATIATLCGWAFTMLHARTLLLPEQSPKTDVVIAEQTMKYLKPGRSGLRAVCRSPVPEAFYRRLQENRSARLELDVEVFSDGQLIATFSGLYVARPER